MTQLQRTTFETSRAAEYFDARQLSALVGVSQDEFASVCLKELVDNSLDACETAGVVPVVGVKVEREDDLIRLSVSDNGPGIPAEVVRKVLDYNVRVSDKAASLGGSHSSHLASRGLVSASSRLQITLSTESHSRGS
jgi:DNA topoisomerase VI subunit B